jgi:sulfate adenylyltransferase
LVDPLSLPVTAEEARSLRLGQTVALVNSAGELVGSLVVSDIFAWDKPRYVQGVYGTSRMDHPGGHMTQNDPRQTLIGGEVRVLPQKPHPEYGRFVLSPVQTRALFREKGWQRVVAFQTRNPLHRAHEYALVAGLERLVAEGHFAGAVLNPLVGETKGDDVDAATRMRTYQALIESKALGEGDKDEALWKKVGCDITDRILLLGLDIKMFYAGPKEAIMHAIYRQNFGFTDLIIGRKHADAPYDDGTDIWDGLAAQRKFDELRGELLIKPVKIGFAAFYEELGESVWSMSTARRDTSPSRSAVENCERNSAPANCPIRGSCVPKQRGFSANACALEAEPPQRAAPRQRAEVLLPTAYAGGARFCHR